jgi:hypothetical protein
MENVGWMKVRTYVFGCLDFLCMHISNDSCVKLSVRVL